MVTTGHMWHCEERSTSWRINNELVRLLCLLLSPAPLHAAICIKQNSCICWRFSPHVMQWCTIYPIPACKSIDRTPCRVTCTNSVTHHWNSATHCKRTLLPVIGTMTATIRRRTMLPVIGMMQHVIGVMLPGIGLMPPIIVTMPPVVGWAIPPPEVRMMHLSSNWCCVMASILQS